MPKGHPTCSKCGEQGHNMRSCGKGGGKPRSRKAAAAAVGTDDELFTNLKDRVAELLAQLDKDVAEAVEQYSIDLAERLADKQKTAMRDRLAALLDGS